VVASRVAERQTGAVQSPTIRCDEFVELVTDWMEGGLSEPVRTEIEEHLLICPPCVVYVKQIRAAVDALRTAERDERPVLRRDELIAAFRASHE
jgi:hypothetical protein